MPKSKKAVRRNRKHKKQAVNSPPDITDCAGIDEYRISLHVFFDVEQSAEPLPQSLHPQLHEFDLPC